MVLAPDKRAKQSAASRGPAQSADGSNGSAPTTDGSGAPPQMNGRDGETGPASNGEDRAAAPSGEREG